jgi:hypothetical protein
LAAFGSGSALQTVPGFKVKLHLSLYAIRQPYSFWILAALLFVTVTSFLLWFSVTFVAAFAFRFGVSAISQKDFGAPASP